MTIDVGPEWNVTFMGPRPSAPKQDSNSPAFITPACDYMYRRSQVCRDLRQGINAVMANAPTYLPQYEGEYEADYKDRLKFASLRNFYAQCVSSVLGKMFAQPPKLNDDVPEQIKTYLNDADLNGNEWTVVGEQLVDNALDEGLSWLLVDYHTVPGVGTLSMADEQELGVRPYWVVVPQSNVLGVRYSYVNNVYTITQFRFFTRITRDAGDFGEETIEQIRVVEPDRYRVYEKGEEGTWNLAVDGDKVNTLGMVPVVCLNLNETGQFFATPPLENLAHMNIEHLQIRSDQRRALSVASFPILATFGVAANSGNVKIGPMTSLAFEDDKASIKWVESNGKHLEAGDRELATLEGHMRTFGLSFENPQMYATATARNIDASDAVAPIQRWAMRFRDAINQALWYTAKWRKMESGGTVNVNTTFLRGQLSVEELKLLLEALRENKMSTEGFLTRMKEYGLLGPEFDPKQDMKKLMKELEELASASGEQNPSPAPAQPDGDTPT